MRPLFDEDTLAAFRKFAKLASRRGTKVKLGYDEPRDTPSGFHGTSSMTPGSRDDENDLPGQNPADPVDQYRDDDIEQRDPDEPHREVDKPEHKLKAFLLANGMSPDACDRACEIAMGGSGAAQPPERGEDEEQIGGPKPFPGMPERGGTMTNKQMPPYGRQLDVLGGYSSTDVLMERAKAIGRELAAEARKGKLAMDDAADNVSKQRAQRAAQQGADEAAFLDANPLLKRIGIV
jgi:hypothetical protein